MSDDGETIWLTAYTEDGAAVPVRLSPVRAIAIAGDLVRAALPKLGAGQTPGRDPHAEQRRENAIRAVAASQGE